LTDVSSADQLQHGTFAENPHVVQIISRWIASERLVENIMSTTVSAAVGNAARLTDPIWQFLTDKAVILGAIAAIIAIAGKFAGGMWRFVAFVAKKRGKGPAPFRVVEAEKFANEDNVGADGDEIRRG